MVILIIYFKRTWEKLRYGRFILLLPRQLATVSGSECRGIHCKDQTVFLKNSTNAKQRSSIWDLGQCPQCDFLWRLRCWSGGRGHPIAWLHLASLNIHRICGFDLSAAVEEFWQQTSLRVCVYRSGDTRRFPVFSRSFVVLKSVLQKAAVTPGLPHLIFSATALVLRPDKN